MGHNAEVFEWLGMVDCHVDGEGMDTGWRFRGDLHLVWICNHNTYHLYLPLPIYNPSDRSVRQQGGQITPGWLYFGLNKR